MTSDIKPLRPSQEDFLRWAIERPGSILDGGMGVGKTRCAIELGRRRGARASLVKTPRSVLPAWASQVSIYDPEAVVIAPSKGTVARKAEQAEREMKDAVIAQKRAFVLINYEASIEPAWSTFELRQMWDLVVLDEVHRIKKPNGTTCKQCTKLRRRAVAMLGMSGTIMPHSPLDVFAQVRAVAPHVFGSSWVAFRARYAVMGGFQGHEVIGYRNLEDMRERLASVTFQIPRSVLGLEEPTDADLPVVLGSAAIRAYHDMERDLVARLDAGEIVATNALVKLLRLSQITGGCVPVDDGESVQAHRIDFSKEDALRELLEGLPATEPVVVFARFRADLDAVHRAAAKCEGGPRASLELSGKRRELERWQAGEGVVLAVQSQSGSIGIDLTRACVGVFYSTSWSLGEYDQARARLHRPPQSRPVVFHHLIAQGTVDVQVRAALRSRRNVVDYVLTELRERRALGDINLRKAGAH